MQLSHAEGTPTGPVARLSHRYASPTPRSPLSYRQQQRARKKQPSDVNPVMTPCTSSSSVGSSGNGSANGDAQQQQQQPQKTQWRPLTPRSGALLLFRRALSAYASKQGGDTVDAATRRLFHAHTSLASDNLTMEGLHHLLEELKTAARPRAAPVIDADALFVALGGSGPCAAGGKGQGGVAQSEVLRALGFEDEAPAIVHDDDDPYAVAAASEVDEPREEERNHQNTTAAAAPDVCIRDCVDMKFLTAPEEDDDAVRETTATLAWDDSNGQSESSYGDCDDIPAGSASGLPPAAFALHMLASYGGGGAVLERAFRGSCRPTASTHRKSAQQQQLRLVVGRMPIRRRHTTSLVGAPRLPQPPSSAAAEPTLDAEGTARFVRASLHGFADEDVDLQEIADALIGALGEDGRLSWSALATGLRVFGVVAAEATATKKKRASASTVSSFASDVPPAPAPRTPFRAPKEDDEGACNAIITPRDLLEPGAPVPERSPVPSPELSPRVEPRPFLGRNLAHLRLGEAPLAEQLCAGNVAATWRRHFGGGPPWRYSARYGGLRRTVRTRCASGSFGALETIEAQLAQHEGSRVVIWGRAQTPRFPAGTKWAVDRKVVLAESAGPGGAATASVWAGLKALESFDAFAAVAASLGPALVEDARAFAAALGAA